MNAVGYYVHHHGDGHRQRAVSIAEQAPEVFTLLGTGLADRTPGLRAIDLPDDRPSGEAMFSGADGTPERPEALHYAPYGHEGIRQRFAQIGQWIADCRPALMVVDVSVEVAMLARLAATPTIYVRLAGRRTDPAHLEAFRGAIGLLAPFAEALDDPDTPDWVRAKTRYLPGLSMAVTETVGLSCDVLVVAGAGGVSFTGEAIAQAARSTAGTNWTVIGPIAAPADAPANLSFLGWVDDAHTRISAGRIVVGAAGDGVLNAVLAADRPFICLPEPRPYDEQTVKAARLAAAGAAVVLDQWPEPGAWPDLLDRALSIPAAARRALNEPDAPRRAADLILATAQDHLAWRTAFGSST